MAALRAAISANEDSAADRLSVNPVNKIVFIGAMGIGKALSAIRADGWTLVLREA